MTTPVVVSRIQNRRGLQSQFEALYPAGYTGIGGYGSMAGFDAASYPNVLLAGEIALCTDSRNIYIGNLNGEYVTFGESVSINDLVFFPLVFLLPPAATFSPLLLPGISFQPTPFFNIVYSLSDNPVVDQNSPGLSFARNGELNITSLIDPYATLTDVGTEINLTGSSIEFQAVYVAGSIEIQYKHNFPTPLIFSTSTIRWVTDVSPPVAYPTFDSDLYTLDSTTVTFDQGP